MKQKRNRIYKSTHLYKGQERTTVLIINPNNNRVIGCGNSLTNIIKL